MENDVPLRIVLEKPPLNVDFGIQKGSGIQYETILKQRSGGNDLLFECKVTLKNNKDVVPIFIGAFVQGPVNKRFLYIDIGTYAGQADSIWGRRLKVPLAGISWDLLNQVMAAPSLILEARIQGTGKDRGPNCGTVKNFDGWKITGR